MTSLYLFLSLFILSQTAAFSFNDYRTHKVFHGEGTYYGGNPYTGNCAIRAPLPKGTYAGRLAVAISDEQYDVACGACLRITGTGKGLGANPIIGPISAYVSDRCFECKTGDLDLSSVGDGRWEINWTVEPCNPAPRIQFLFEGSNEHFWKLQPRGMTGPCTQILVDGTPAVLKQDNHWVYQTVKAKKKAKVTVKTVMGDVITSWVTMVPQGISNGASLHSGRKWNRGNRRGRWRRRRRHAWKWHGKNRWHRRNKPWNRKPRWNKSWNRKQRYKKSWGRKQRHNKSWGRKPRWNKHWTRKPRHKRHWNFSHRNNRRNKKWHRNSWD